MWPWSRWRSAASRQRPCLARQGLERGVLEGNCRARLRRLPAGGYTLMWGRQVWAGRAGIHSRLFGIGCRRGPPSIRAAWWIWAMASRRSRLGAILGVGSQERQQHFPGVTVLDLCDWLHQAARDLRRDPVLRPQPWDLGSLIGSAAAASARPAGGERAWRSAELERCADTAAAPLLDLQMRSTPGT